MTSPQPAVALGQNHSMLAVPETRIGPVDSQFHMDRMVLLLQPSAAQQQMLDALAAAQQDEGSPLFHQWLTPADYADFFGIPAAEAANIASWLVSHGFRVDEIAASRRMIVFSGTTGAIDTTFHTQMMRYTVHGEERIANRRPQRGDQSEPRVALRHRQNRAV